MPIPVHTTTSHETFNSSNLSADTMLHPDFPAVNGAIHDENKNSLIRRRRTAHDWTSEREMDVVDDGTMTFFW